jgi:hypothetical protein
MKVTPREKKFLVIGGSVAAMGTLLYLSLLLIPSGAGLAGTVELKKKMLLKYKETLLKENEYKARIEEYRARLNQDLSRLLPYENPAIASAEMQRILKEMADQNGVEIIRRDAVQREQKVQENLLKVSVTIETNCLPEQLVRFIAAIENYDKFLAIDELNINSYRIQKKYEIRPRITVSGFIAAPEAKPAPKPAGGA